MSRDVIYLDNAAATPVLDEVVEAMRPYYSERYFNPSATYSEGLAVRKNLEETRSAVAHWLGAKNSEIIFTSGGTESNNLAIQGVMSQYPEANAVTSAIEHESVLSPVETLNNRKVGVSADGSLKLNELEKAIDNNTVLVSIMYANNEVGTIQHLREVSKIVGQKRRQRGSALPLYLHTDACQAANYLDLHISRLGVDMMTLNGGKIYGPKQSGCLFVKSSVNIKPLVLGGGQERGLRSGTENIANIVGFAKALDIAQSSRHDETDRLHQLQQTFIKKLTARLPEIEINGSKKMRLPNNVHVTFTGQDNERLLIQLDQAGILAAAGSACSASSDEPSHVLAAMGISEVDARASLRLTLGRETSQQDLDKVVKTLAQLVKD